MPQTLFISELWNLQTLYLNGNRLTRLSKSLFKYTFKLKYLNVADNRLKTIPTLTLSSAKIEFHGNCITITNNSKSIELNNSETTFGKNRILQINLIWLSFMLFFFSIIYVSVCI